MFVLNSFFLLSPTLWPLPLKLFLLRGRLISHLIVFLLLWWRFTIANQKSFLKSKEKKPEQRPEPGQDEQHRPSLETRQTCRRTTTMHRHRSLSTLPFFLLLFYKFIIFWGGVYGRAKGIVLEERILIRFYFFSLNFSTKKRIRCTSAPLMNRNWNEKWNEAIVGYFMCVTNFLR